LIYSALIYSAIEKSVACLVLLDQLLLVQFIVSESLSVLFEFPSEGVFAASGVIILSGSHVYGCVLGGHEGSVRGCGPSTRAVGSLHSSVGHCRLLGGCGY